MRAQVYFSFNDTAVALFTGIIPHDTRHEETIMQIANTLDSLQTAVTHVFRTIDDRLNEYGRRYFYRFVHYMGIVMAALTRRSIRFICRL